MHFSNSILRFGLVACLPTSVMRIFRNKITLKLGTLLSVMLDTYMPTCYGNNNDYHYYATAYKLTINLVCAVYY